MAFIGRLRDKMGTWVVVFVFIAIAAFILGDIFSGNSNIMNWGRNKVGEIGGKEITIEEYQLAVQKREANFYQSNGYEPGEREKIGLRQSAWDALIAEHAVAPQFAKVGIEVTEAELIDMVNGKNISPDLQRAFANPETGEFDRNKLSNQLDMIKNSTDPGMRGRWAQFENDLVAARRRIKYENLILKSVYVTSAEAELEYHMTSDVAEVKYLFVPFHAVSDTAVTVSDSDLQEYYNKNKERFKTKETRGLKYVMFPVIASAEDSAVVKSNMEAIVDDLKASKDDSAYTNTISNATATYQKYNAGSLPDYVQEADLVEGNVIGPVVDGNTFRVVKISKVFNDTSYAARAKHILIRWADTTEDAKKKAKEEAQAILKDIKAGADFSAKARQFGTDGTKERGGDLGWFSSGQMVKPFEKAVFAATKTGPLNDVVETDFGYHLIDVTNLKTNKAYNLTIVEEAIVPLDKTTNDVYRQAELFADDLSGESEFEARAKEKGLTVYEAKTITPADNHIGELGEARQIVQWLYRDAEVGKVSTMFNLNDLQVVAVMTNRVEAGYKPFELVKNEIKPQVVNEQKGKMIIEKLNKQKGTLEEIASAYGTDANVYTKSDLKLADNAMTSVGYDPKSIGFVFAQASGKRSAPATGDNGVILVELQNKTVAPEAGDYSAYQDQLKQSVYSSNSMNIAEAIKEGSDIEDERFKAN
jgi:peptidyl-prolyl cis-trans isomerase D